MRIQAVKIARNLMPVPERYAGLEGLGIIPTTAGTPGVTTATLSGECELPATPSWCSWMPFADFVPDCAPYSDAELHQLTVCMANKVSKGDPTLFQNAVVAGDASQALAQKPANTPASDTCELNAALNFPSLASVFGPSLVCKMGGGNTQDSPGFMPYAVLGAVAVAGLMFISSFRR